MTNVISGALGVVRRLEEAGYEAVLVGGIVRDLLCGFPPADADIASNIPLADAVPLFPAGRLLGPEGMKVLLLPLEQGHCEVFSYSGGSLKDDLSRRDFTVNALALRRTGEVVGSRRSMADVASRVLRFNGPARERLAEDPLRALRLARFAAVLPGFVPVSETAAACRKARPSLQKCAPERVGREIRLGLEGNPRIFLEMVRECGLLDFIFPGMPSREFDFSRLCRILDGLAQEGADIEVRAAALFSLPWGGSSRADDGSSAAEAALTAWKWPDRAALEAAELVRQRRLPLGSPEPERMAALFEARGTHFMDSLFLLSRQFFVGEPHFRRWSENRALYVSMAARALREDVLPTGGEIMNRFSLAPGPFLGQLLAALKLRRLHPGFASKEEAFSFIETLLRNPSSPYLPCRTDK